MASIALGHNTLIDIEGVLHRIVSWVSYDRINLQRCSDNDVVSMTMTEIIKKVEAGKAYIKTVRHKDAHRRARLEKKLRADLDGLPEHTRRVFDRRYAYVEAISEQMPLKKNKSTLEPIIAEVGQKISDPSTPGFSSVCRWLSDYESAGKDPRSLVPSYDKRGNRARRLDDRVLEILEDGISQEFLNKRQGSPMAVLDYANLKIAAENNFREDSEKLSLVDERTVYREIEKIDTYKKACKRLGKSIADKMFRSGGNAPKATRPLERVEIDHTILNLFLVDEETGMIVGRPTITVAIDCYTRMILGFYIGFEPPGWQAVMHCLRHAILPKDKSLARFSSIKGTLSCCGVPETIVVDNGREFHSTDFVLACAQLGIEIQYSPRAKPWFKGKVERIFRTIETTFLTGSRGKVISKLLQDTEYDPMKDAVVGMNCLIEAFCKWVVDVYSQDFHRGINCSPSEMWQRGLEEFSGIRIPASLEDFMIVMSSSETRTVQHYGVDLNGVRYKSVELGYLRQAIHKGKNPTVCVKFDPSDLGYIRVQDPRDGSYLAVPAEDLDYAAGTNFWQNKIICRWRYRQRKRARQDLTLAEARDQIRAMLNEAKLLRLPTAVTSRTARFKGEGSNRLLSAPEEFQPVSRDEQGCALSDEEFRCPTIYDEDDEEWGISSNENYPE